MFTYSLSKSKNFRKKTGQKCNDNTSQIINVLFWEDKGHVTEQLQNPKIKECLVLLIRNKFWRSVWINTNGCSQQQNKGYSLCTVTKVRNKAVRILLQLKILNTVRKEKGTTIISGRIGYSASVTSLLINCNRCHIEILTRLCAHSAHK